MPIQRNQILRIILLTLTFSICFGTVTFAEIQQLDDAPPSYPPEESAKLFKVPKGFKIELVASEPLLEDPSGIAFDERGRMLVCELHGYNLEGWLDVVELNKTGKLDMKIHRYRITGRLMDEAKRGQIGKVKLLTDTDGDGRMDKATVWADDLPPCYGIVPARQGVIVACAPDIIYLADRDGDGNAEVRERLFTGFKVTLMERAINCPRWGLDNWIHFGAGGEGGMITGPNLPRPVKLGHSDFRIKADGSAVEWDVGSVGTYGLAVNEVGDQFPASGGQPGIYALPLPNRYLDRNPYVPVPSGNHSSVGYHVVFRNGKPHPWRTKRASDPRWVNFYGPRETNSSYFTGGCGNDFYEASLFPEEFRGNLFSCEPSQNIIHRCVIERNGSGYNGGRAPGEEESEFLSTTESWFRPVDARVGPDGALYIVDMYREIIEDYSAIPRFLQQQYGLMNGSSRGRIWRLVPESKAPREIVDLSKSSTDELVRLTQDPDAWWRKTAQRLLIERGDAAAVPALSLLARTGDNSHKRLRALYTLDGLGRLSRDDAIAALSDADYAVRMHGLRLAERWLGSDDELLRKVTSMTSDDDQRVRLQVALSLGEADNEKASLALLEMAQKRGGERWMKSALLSSVRDTAGQLLTNLLESDEITPGAENLLSALASTVAARRDGNGMEVLLKLIPGHNQNIQRRCLEGFVYGLSRGSGEIDASGRDWSAVINLVASPSQEVRSQAIELGGLLSLAGTPEMKTLFAHAVKDVNDESKSLEDRQKAIRILASASFATLSPIATPLLDPRRPIELQLAALEALGASDDDGVSDLLLKNWKNSTPTVRNAKLDALFALNSRLPALLDAVENKTVHPSDIASLRREQLFKNRNRIMAARAKKLLADGPTDAEVAKLMELYQTALANDRDTARGKEVFAKTCASCHKLHDVGHEVGPDLRGVLNRPDIAILTDVLDPSRHIESEYRTYVIETDDGKIHEGVLSSEAGGSITLKLKEGKTDSILRKNIADVIASDLSLMPSDLYKDVKPQDLADVIAYLRKALAPAGTKTTSATGGQ